MTIEGQIFDLRLVWFCFPPQLELMDLRSQQQDMEQIIKEQRSDMESR